MRILQGAIHVFTDRPDLAAKAFCREIEAQQKQKAMYEEIYEVVNKEYQHDYIIQYPHAVSFFCGLNLSYEYIAEIYSKRRKAPVLVSIVGVDNLNELQGYRFWWGAEGKCGTAMEASLEHQKPTSACEGIPFLKNKLRGILPDNSVLFGPLDAAKPLEIVAALSEELGIFLGGEELDAFLSRCQLVKKYELGAHYKTCLRPEVQHERN